MRIAIRHPYNPWMRLSSLTTESPIAHGMRNEIAARPQRKHLVVPSTFISKAKLSSPETFTVSTYDRPILQGRPVIY